MSGPPILYLSAEEVQTVGLGPAEVLAAIEAMFRAKSAGETLTRPKLSIAPRPGDLAEALVGVSLAEGVAGCKWLSVTGDNPARGLPSIHALVLVNDLVTGRPRAIMDGAWITGMRTAACTALAAKHLAPEASETLAFIGCGLQARTHLDALCQVRPGLRHVLCHSRTEASAARFAGHCRARGLVAEVSPDPRAAISAADIVVTSVPAGDGVVPFLDAGWLRETAFVGAIDLGRSWRAASWHGAFACTATDDRAQSEARGAAGIMLVPDRFDAELGDLPACARASGAGRTGRGAMLFSGIAIADLAVALALEARARALGIGTRLAP